VPPREPRLPTPSQAVIAWLLAIVLVLGMGFGVGAVAALIAIGEGLKPDAALSLISDPHSSPLVSSPTWIGVTIALNELTVFGLLVLWRRRLLLPFRAIVPTGTPTLRATLGAVLLPFGLAPLAELVGELVRRSLPHGVSSDHIVLALARGTSAELFLLVLGAAAVLPAVVEELMFRGFVTTALQGYSPFAKLVLPSLMFGVLHLEPTQAAGVAVLGIAFGLVRLYTGSIWPCIISHFAYNAGTLLEARWFERSQTHVTSWTRVLLGLGLALAAYALLVADLGKRRQSPFSILPPPPSSRGFPPPSSRGPR
jgi:membrane protease YdiL (CAAX protease family)